MKNLRAMLILVATLTTQFAQAQSAPATSMEPVTVYSAEFFADATPADALDMVLRLPGFTIVDSDADQRGYAGSQGNVLIDGARPTSKYEDVEDMLERIPAASVKRIELIRAGLSGIDMAGHAMLVNVVRDVKHDRELVLETGLVMAPGGWIKPLAQLDFSGQKDERALQLVLSTTPELDDDSGSGHENATSAEGDPLEYSRTRDLEEKSESEVGVNWRQPLGDGTLRVSSAVRREEVDVLSRIHTLRPDEKNETESETETATEAELSASFNRDLNATTAIDVMVSQQRLRQDGSSNSSDEAVVFEETSEAGERIARVELTHQTDSQIELTSSLEGALNRLQGRASLIRDGAPIAIPGSDVDIQEQRVEASGSGTWSINDRWRMETGLRAELSTIKQRGDSPLTREFTYVKPHLALNWRANNQNRIRFSLAREVGQLDFEDFVASAAIDTGTISAGNARLQPDTLWQSSVGWEHTLGKSGALRVTWKHDQISDAIDRVLIAGEDGETFDAPGNIGDGVRDSVTIELSGSLDHWGLQGLRFASNATRRFSRVTDPVTGEHRTLSGEPSYEGEISLTHTQPTTPWSWGINLELAETEREFQYDEVSTERSGYSLSLFAERRIGARWRFSAEVINPLGRTFTENRTNFEGPRSQTTAEELEFSEHQLPTQVMLTFRRTTGS